MSLLFTFAVGPQPYPSFHLMLFSFYTPATKWRRAYSFTRVLCQCVNISAIFFCGDYEIFSVVILSLPLIQEGQLSVSGERNVHNTG